LVWFGLRSESSRCSRISLAIGDNFLPTGALLISDELWQYSGSRTLIDPEACHFLRLGMKQTDDLTGEDLQNALVGGRAVLLSP